MASNNPLNVKTLDEIALHYGTDKSSAHHNYCQVYERYFDPIRSLCLSVLEFGVEKGASIRTWLEYFPCADVVGVDILDCPPVNDPRYKFIKGQISDPALWDSLGKFDIIIDDDGHRGEETITAISLGIPHLNPGGLLIAEDLHTCYNPHFTPPGTPNPLDFLRGALDSLNDHGIGECGDNRKDTCPVEFIHFWKSLVFIGKRS